MKFSICNELYFDRSFEAACQSAAELGYQGIEIAPFTLGESVFEITSQVRRETARTAAKYGLQIVGLHWLLAKTNGLQLISGTTDVRRRTLEYLTALVELCRDLGGQIMVLGSPQQRNLDSATTAQQGFSRARDLFQQLVPVLEAQNIVLAVEPLGPEETSFLTTAESTIRLIRDIGSEHVGLILDVKAMSTELISIPQIIEQSQGCLKHFHANDPNRQGPGMGAVDFVPILKSLKQIGYTGWVSVEVFDYSPGIDRIASQSIRTLQQATTA